MVARGEKEERRVSQRKRQVSHSLRKVDEHTRKQLAAARLDALENDNLAPDMVGADDSDDYQLSSEDDGLGSLGGRKKKKVAKKAGRALQRRGAINRSRGAKSFSVLLEEAEVEDLPSPNYLTAAASPPVAYPPRFFCSICGFTAPYTCVRCGARFCCRKCSLIHCDTRCMKFTA
mmetsp:Transcript_10974/g.14927  ORF Transcript_10974/g.14927 Transcript_10974/m.14927 type:complete len:175 (+) Transcript_10974:75-599(+)|eukprot:CAMPEP_0196578664 /NCGR_PEP_ID=MMETSP1081-20130531/7521_1 /TAXON_ID=36882 /ORGANISM="Pyramimonas amylifera, Strain CCMP720" /LENGTH=174 /DNA_ID=CAMNT_0041897947 /DNA_START=155 /DNA_END=679 /DNA_ORIENTATION=+